MGAVGLRRRRPGPRRSRPSSTTRPRSCPWRSTSHVRGLRSCSRRAHSSARASSARRAATARARVSLPRAAELNRPFDRTVLARRSARGLAPGPLTLPELAAMLDAAYGVTAAATAQTPPLGRFRRPARCTPSSCIVLCRRVRGLPAAVHHFDPLDRVLADSLRPRSDRRRRAHALRATGRRRGGRRRDHRRVLEVALQIRAPRLPLHAPRSRPPRPEPLLVGSRSARPRSCSPSAGSTTGRLGAPPPDRRRERVRALRDLDRTSSVIPLRWLLWWSTLGAVLASTCRDHRDEAESPLRSDCRSPSAPSRSSHSPDPAAGRSGRTARGGRRRCGSPCTSPAALPSRRRCGEGLRSGSSRPPSTRRRGSPCQRQDSRRRTSQHRDGSPPCTSSRAPRSAARTSPPVDFLRPPSPHAPTTRSSRFGPRPRDTADLANRRRAPPLYDRGRKPTPADARWPLRAPGGALGARKRLGRPGRRRRPRAASRRGARAARAERRRKTTAVKLLLGLRRPDAGRVAVFGADPTISRSRLPIGTTPQDVSFPPTLRVGEIVTLVQAHFLDHPTRDAVPGRFSLVHLRERQAGGLSGGERRRLALALAFAGRPRAVFLDEPTTGPRRRGAGARSGRTVRSFADAGGSVLLTTHSLEEADSRRGSWSSSTAGSWPRARRRDPPQGEIARGRVAAACLPPCRRATPHERRSLLTADPDAVVTSWCARIDYGAAGRARGPRGGVLDLVRGAVTVLLAHVRATTLEAPADARVQRLDSAPSRRCSSCSSPRGEGRRRSGADGRLRRDGGDRSGVLPVRGRDRGRARLPWEAYVRSLPVGAATRMAARVVSGGAFALAAAAGVAATAAVSTNVTLPVGRWLLLEPRCSSARSRSACSESPWLLGAAESGAPDREPSAAAARVRRRALDGGSTSPAASTTCRRHCRPDAGARSSGRPWPADRGRSRTWRSWPRTRSCSACSRSGPIDATRESGSGDYQTAR